MRVSWNRLRVMFLTIRHDCKRCYHEPRFIFSSFSLIFLFVLWPLVLFVPCGGLSWSHVSFLLHVKYTVPYRIVTFPCWTLTVGGWLASCFEQDGLLSQRNRAMLRVTRYFAKSLKVIQNDTLEYGVCKFLLVFHCSFVSRTVSEIFSVT